MTKIFTGKSLLEQAKFFAHPIVHPNKNLTSWRRFNNAKIH